MPQPSYNSYKYQQLSPAAYHTVYQNGAKGLSGNVKSHQQQHQQKVYSPFQEKNKIPGEFVPIFKANNLPYQTYNDAKHVEDETETHR